MRWGIFHAPGRLIHRSRQRVVRIIDGWPGTDALLGAYRRIGSSPERTRLPLLGIHGDEARLRNPARQVIFDPPNQSNGGPPGRPRRNHRRWRSGTRKCGAHRPLHSHEWLGLAHIDAPVWGRCEGHESHGASTPRPVSPMPEPGDPCPASRPRLADAGAWCTTVRCKPRTAMRTPSWTGRWFSPRGDRWLHVWACRDHLERADRPSAVRRDPRLGHPSPPNGHAFLRDGRGPHPL